MAMARWARLSLAALVVAVAGTGAGTAPVAVAMLWGFDTVLVSSDLTAGRAPLSTKISDRNGRLLNEVFQDTRRSPVDLSQVSPFLVHATIATEDGDFSSNWGISVRGMARALWYNLSARAIEQGGSTITQQLVKNTLIPEEDRFARTVGRKVREAIFAVLLTMHYTKDQILEWYLNQVFYGNNSYGIETAARSYFDKPARDLSLAEASLLAGLPSTPALYDPYTRPDQARARQRTVLDLMVNRGFISQDQADAAAQEPLPFQPQHFPMAAPHFVMHIRELLETRYGADALYRGGLRVTTSLDLDLQQQAERIIAESLASPEYQRRNAHNAALVAVRPQTGEVLALVGSSDFNDDAIGGQVNMALSPRQPGSAFKPITYANAFLNGWNPATRVHDRPTPFLDGRGGQWVPKNADNRYRGWVPVRQALALSLNTPAVLALQHTGIQPTLDLAHSLGITTLEGEGYGLALTLGAGEVSLFDLTYVYGVFATNGIQNGVPRPRRWVGDGLRELDPVVLLRVEGPDGRLLEEAAMPQSRQVLPAPYAYFITSILADDAARTPMFGPRSALMLDDRPAAAKTGTTDDLRDNWAVGYTPDLVAGVWVGNTDNAPMTSDAFGGTSAAPIWKAFMTAALQDTEVHNFPMPPGVVLAPVCPATGTPPGRSGCAGLYHELFVQGAVPAPAPEAPQPEPVPVADRKPAPTVSPPVRSGPSSAPPTRTPTPTRTNSGKRR